VIGASPNLHGLPPVDKHSYSLISVILKQQKVKVLKNAADSAGYTAIIKIYDDDDDGATVDV